jgi:hypothetical protein
MKLSQVLVVFGIAAAIASCSSPGIGKDKLGPLRSESAAGLAFQVPESWEGTPPSSQMRAAQFTLPAAEGSDHPELTVYFFGHGQGGTTQANIERWIGQMTQPGGKSAEAKAKEETRQVGEFKVTTVRVNGTYAAGSSMMPGMGKTEDKPDYALWGAVVEGEGGPWFFKATGPEGAMKQAEPGFVALVSSLKRSAAPPDTGLTR